MRTILTALCVGALVHAGGAQVIIQSGKSTIVLRSGAAARGEPEKKVADDGEKKIPELDAKVREQLERALGAPRADLAPLHAALVAADLAHGSLDPVLKTLGTWKDDPSKRRAALWNDSWTRRIAGDVEGAEESLAEIARDRTQTPDPLVLGAWGDTLEMLARPLEALAAWHRAAELTADPVAKAKIELRAAILRRDVPPQQLAATGKDVLGLAAFGLLPDGTLRESLLTDRLVERARIARPDDRRALGLVLALAGDPEKAGALAVEDVDQFRSSLRAAEWALRAGQIPAAKEHAMKAVKAAPLARDRRYALSLLLDTYRRADELGVLAEKLGADAAATAEEQEVWVELLRTLDRVDQAVALLDSGKTPAGVELTPVMRRGLLDLCVEAKKDDVAERLYRQFMNGEPDRLDWRLGLARFFIDRGRFAEAEALWREYLAAATTAAALIEGAKACGELGLEALVIEQAKKAAETADGKASASIYLADFYLQRGRPAEAERILKALDEALAADAKERFDLAEANERLGKKVDAVRILEGLRKTRTAEDLEMKLGWLYSEVGREDDALEVWLILWRTAVSAPRKTYAEDRILTVASRLGKLADIAIDLEQKLEKGEGGELERGLLVKLYTKANDPVSAAEILDDFGKKTGKAIEALREMAKVYLECNDYLNYELTMNRLIEADKENSGDLMRQMAMSALERARPDSARALLSQIKDKEASTDAEEFEAGVLSLAGLYDESTAAYRKAIAKWPDHIEAYLLLARDMVALGKKREAGGIFQHLALTADKEDLFGVAIDGLMNIDADPETLKWARRKAYERMAAAPDKMHYYHLLADVSDALGDQAGARRALEEALPLAGERRLPMLRELMDMAGEGDRESLIAYGRRVVALGEQVPPDVYLDLGQAFLAGDDVRTAARTFSIVRDVPDFNAYQRRVAQAFEQSKKKKEALDVYQRTLVRQPTEVSLLAKVGELNEELRDETAAAGFYDRAVELLLARRPAVAGKATKAADDEDSFGWGGHNTDDFDRHYRRTLSGTLAVRKPHDLDAVFAAHRPKLAKDIEDAKTERGSGATFNLDRFPRVRDRAAFLRRQAFALGRPELALPIDLELLAVFTDDHELLGKLVEERIDFGFAGQAKMLIEASNRPAAEKEKQLFIAGSGVLPTRGEIRGDIARRLLLPMIAAGDRAGLSGVIRRVALPALDKSDLETMPILVSAAAHVGDPDTVLSFSRRRLQAAFKFQKDWQLNSTVRTIFASTWAVLPEELRKSLVDELLAVYLADVKKYRALSEFLGDLQKASGRELITPEALETAFKAAVKDRPWELTSLLNFVPEKKRIDRMLALVNDVKDDFKIDFLTQTLRESKAEIEEDKHALITDVFRATLKTGKEPYAPQQVAYMVGQMQENAKLAVALGKMLVELEPQNFTFLTQLGRACKRARMTQEALACANRALNNVLENGKDDDYRSANAFGEIADIYGDSELETMLSVVNVFEERGGVTALSAIARSQVFRQWGRIDKAVAALKEGLARAPKSDPVIQQLRSLLISTGRAYESVLLLEKMVANHPDRPYYTTMLKREWENLGNPIKAAAVIVKQSPNVRVMNDTGGPTAMKAALDAGEIDKFRDEVRRYTRKFGTSEDGFFYDFDFGGQDLWPEDEAKAEEGTLRDLDGGETKARRSLWDVVAEQPFGLDEIEVNLRAKDGGRLDAAGGVITAYAKALAKRDGAETVVARMLEKVAAGTAGKIEYAVLIELLGSSPEGMAKAVVAAEAVLEMCPPDNDVMVSRLAELNARMQRYDEAARLFEWSFTLRGPEVMQGWRAGAMLEEAADRIAKSMPEKYRDALLAKMLDAMKPSDFSGGRFAGYGGDFEMSVLKLSARVLGPKLALERNKTILEHAFDDPYGWGRNRPLLAVIAGLMARAGRLDEATRYLEGAYTKSAREDMVAYGQGRIADLLPKIVPEWPEARAWYDLVVARAREWQEQRRINRNVALQILAHAAWRRFEAGDKDGAKPILDEALASTGEYAYEHLFIADIARKFGQEEVAFAIERKLLDENRLSTRRIARVLGRMVDTGERSAAVARGETIVEYSPRPETLKILIPAARAEGKKELADRFVALGKKVAPKDASWAEFEKSPN